MRAGISRGKLHAGRSLGLALALAVGFSGQALAGSEFDATGQFFFGFKLGATAKEKDKPHFGFRFGSSNVPRTKMDQYDPLRRGLNTTFDRRDESIQTFSGVGITFDQNSRTINLLEDSLGAGQDGEPAEVFDLRSASPRGSYALDEETEAYDFRRELSSPYSWAPAPVIGPAETTD